MENILILDDHPATLHGIADVLRVGRTSLHPIIEASTGLQAVETGRQCRRLSLLVTDIELPDLSGTEVALVLSARYPHLAILFMSANAIADWRSRDRANLKRFTPDLVDFLEKPFFASGLKMRVQNLIGRTIRLAKKIQGNQAA